LGFHFIIITIAVLQKMPTQLTIME